MEIYLASTASRVPGVPTKWVVGAGGSDGFAGGGGDVSPSRIVTKSFLRYLPRRLSLSLLQLMGVACGVAAVVGMTMSAQTALSSFTKAVEFLRGNATHSMQRPAGPMEEDALARLARDPAVEWFSPVIDRRLRLGNGDLVRFLAIDPFLDRIIRPEIADAQPARDKANPEESLSFLLDDRAILVDKDLAMQLGLSTGNILETTRGTFRMAGSFTNPSGEPLVLMDIAHAQKLFALQGFVDRVDLILTDESAFRERWKDGFLIQSGRQRSETFSAMLGAFRLNLEALSLLALFVGVFLIYNTAMFAVVSRRRDTGICAASVPRGMRSSLLFLRRFSYSAFSGAPWAV